MAQFIKHVLRNPEDPSSDPQQPCKWQAGVVAHMQPKMSQGSYRPGCLAGHCMFRGKICLIENVESNVELITLCQPSKLLHFS